MEAIEDHLKNSNITMLDCEELQVKKNHSASFKISVKEDDEVKIMNCELWPQSVQVKPFMFNWTPYKSNSTYFRRNFHFRKPHQHKY